MEALTAMGFPEHMCSKAMRMTGGDVEAAANYIMGNLDQPEQWWFGPPGERSMMAAQMVVEVDAAMDEDEDGLLAIDGVDGVEALLESLDPDRREAFAEAAVAALRALTSASMEDIASLGIEEGHARLLREPPSEAQPRSRSVSPPEPSPGGALDEEAAADDGGGPRSHSPPFGAGPDLAAALSASNALEEALGRARQLSASPRVPRVAAAPVPAAAPPAVFRELEDDTENPPAFLLCGQGLEIVQDGLQVRRSADATAQHCWAATTAGRKYVEIVVQSISGDESMPASSPSAADARGRGDPFGSGAPADIMLSMLRGEDGDSPFASPFGAAGGFGFGERPLQPQGLSRFGVRTGQFDVQK